MLLLKGLLIVFGAGLGLLALGRPILGTVRPAEGRAPRWRPALASAAAGLTLVLLGLGLVVVPPGRAAVRISQISGVRPGVLGPGIHYVPPLVEEVAVYDVREHVLTTVTAADPEARGEALRAQTKEGLEAEARKEATLKNAEAAAQAKVIDSKAEVERSNLMAGAEAHRIRVTSLAENERMKLESEVLRENPLLIQKIVAERLSDKMQIMMVPMDGRNFFANEVFRSSMPPLDPPPPAPASPKAVARR